MRDIIFRAKRNDGYDEWVQGDLIHDENDGSVRIAPKAAYSTGTHVMFDNAPRVDPATVGQYTGQTDRDGTRIFEGDIVEYPIEQGRFSKSANRHEVTFETRGGAGYFGIKMDRIETWRFCMEVPAKLMRVIGNIHDNPELLGGDGDA